MTKKARSSAPKSQPTWSELPIETREELTREIWLRTFTQYSVDRQALFHTDEFERVWKIEKQPDQQWMLECKELAFQQLFPRRKDTVMFIASTVAEERYTYNVSYDSNGEMIKTAEELADEESTAEPQTESAE